MALERQSIEKKDFPIGRRGYDPEAVDAHLQSLADEIEQLKRASRRRTETLASAASEQVRAIVEAAETTAAEIQQQAEQEAGEIRAEAGSEAKATREQAVGQAREYVGKVSESTAVMLQRLDAMDSELGALIEALRTGANRLNADLQLLEGNLNDVGAAVTPRPRFEPEFPAPAGYGAAPTASTAAHAAPAPAAPAPARAPQEDAGVRDEQDGGRRDVPESSAPARGGAAHGDQPSEGSNGAEGEDEGARLIALNMALDGRPREETDRYLAENFRLTDRRGLLDEVYARVGG